MSENRRQILQMLSEGKINADEAERLIAALERESASSEPLKGEALKPRAKYLRVLVEADETHSGGSQTKVNVRVPMKLLRAGVRLSALLPPQARDRANAALREQGIPFDLNQIKPENLEELVEQLNDFEVNVDDDHAKVRVFCE